MRRLFVTVAVAVMAFSAVVAQGKMSGLAATMIAEKKMPVADNSMFRGLSRMENNREMVDCYVHFYAAVDESVLGKYDVALHARYDNLAMVTAAVPLDMMEALSNDPAVKYVEAGTPMKFDMNKARPISLAQMVIDGGGILSQNYLGRGVVLGIVDTEIQLNHPNFYDTSHQNFRIKKYWNQNSTGGTHPQGYEYGAEFTSESAILGQKYDFRQPSSGHATHVLGIAAGACMESPNYGIARESELVMVSAVQTMYNSTSTSLSDGIKYIVDYANSVGKPCVVNVSMGGFLGPHDGTSTECKVIDELAKQKGVLICGSASNSGDVKEHAKLTLQGNDSVAKTFLSYESSAKLGMFDVWGEVGKRYGIQVVVYDRDEEEFVCQTDTVTFDMSKDVYTFNLTKSSVNLSMTVTIAKSINPDNNRGNYLVTTNLVKDIPARHLVGVLVFGKDAGEVNMWSTEDYCKFSNYGMKKDGWTDGDTDMTLGEPMGVANGVISVGSYTSYSQYASQKVGARSSFSSKGPTLDGRIKPDICAPGQTLLSSIPDCSSLSKDRVEEVTVGGNKYYYGYMQGTSMSSPYCAGVMATWLEANPELDQAQVKEIFRNTAIIDDQIGRDVPNSKVGYGKLNAYAGILWALGLNASVRNPESPEVLAVYPNPTDGELNIGFAVSDSKVNIVITDLSGKTVYNDVMNDVQPGDNINVDMSDVLPGAYILKVAGETVNDTFKLIKR